MASSQAISKARELEWPLTEVTEGVFETEAPGGYKFYLQKHNGPQSGNYLCINASFCLKTSSGGREGASLRSRVESLVT